jgi:predicted nucleic acid-binding protein
MTTTGGRRPVLHNVFTIEDKQLVLPDAVVLDTSFLVEALIDTEPLHTVCDAFLTRIDETGMTVITNALLRAELAEASFANAMKERWRGKWRPHRSDGRSRPRAARLMNNALGRYDQLLESLPQISVPLDQVADSAVHIMAKYGLASYDAIHAATAIAAGADTMVTLDTGFGLMPASLLTLYTDHSRLATCRKNRPRR